MSASRFNAPRLAVYSKHPHRTTASVLLLVLVWSFASLSERVQAQAPGLLWSTNIGARVFAVDSLTNVYANAGGTVIVLNSAGVPLETNAICPRPALAARAADGSSPALLRVKHVAIFDGDQLLTSGTHVFSSPPTLTIRSTFTNGSAFYTLDGSAPGFASTHYSGPFVLPQSATGAPSVTVPISPNPTKPTRCMRSSWPTTP